ncbi:carnitine acetyl transferase [Pterulicium gracile]|uniref:Carnitine acetyl transferase n=1 Tax=Pterulicium gracile TaxID=1884261 RepID=A0A5C3QT40_9AGAR|nr:carnitine acetyl transferase [Pterula gracilis]
MSFIRTFERPSAWKEASPAFPQGSQLQKSQASLPKLPVPELTESLERLRESLKPVAWSDEEFSAASRKIEEFAKGLGPELHKRLAERAGSTPHWLEEWWDDAGYLTYRDPVIIYVTYYYGFKAHPSHLKQTPANRAAAISRAGMVFRDKLKQGDMSPEATKEGPLCMDTYRWMFDCSRVPGPQGVDWAVTYTEEKAQNSHIIVFRNNRPWIVETLREGRILSTEEIERQFQHIYDHSEGAYPGVGVMTANNRDTWAKDYTELAKSDKNRDNLHAIQSAAFSISLDTQKPEDPASFSKSLWHGEVASEGSKQHAKGLQNRWADKPLQFIVYDNCKAGIMGEHSIMDGTPVVRFCEDVLDMVADQSFDHGKASGELKGPIPLDWELNANSQKALVDADAAAVELATSHELSFTSTSYGKAAIKQFKVSPDSWAQMTIQLAHRRLFPNADQERSTYESASTRKFFKGRTETIRVLSAESNAFVTSMDDPKFTDVQRKELFDKASKKHLQSARLAGNGQGCDRVMFGMKKLLKDGETMPDIYSDAVYQRSSKWILSTSSIYCKHFDVYGWGEVVPDGFGVPYTTGFDDRLQFTVTSRKEMPNTRFLSQIARAAQDLYDLHVDTLPQAKSSL